MHWAWEETWICQVSCFFCCISWKSSTAFPCCPAFTYFPNILFHEKLLPWQPALVPPIGRFIGPRAKSNPVSSYAWHLGTMHSPSLVYNHTTVKDLQKSHTKLSLSGLLLLLVPTFHPEKLLQVTMCPKYHNSRVSQWRPVTTSKNWWSNQIEGIGNCRLPNNGTVTKMGRVTW